MGPLCPFINIPPDPSPLTLHTTQPTAQAAVVRYDTDIHVVKVLPVPPKVVGPRHQGGLGGLREVTLSGAQGRELFPEVANTAKTPTTGCIVYIPWLVDVLEILL